MVAKHGSFSARVRLSGRTDKPKSEILTIEEFERRASNVISYQEVYEANLGDYDAIIGMDIITRGDFHLDSSKGEPLFSFQLPNE